MYDRSYSTPWGRALQNGSAASPQYGAGTLRSKTHRLDTGPDSETRKLLELSSSSDTITGGIGNGGQEGDHDIKSRNFG